MNVYVYYDVALAVRAQTAAQVRAMQATLGDCARRIALLRRLDDKPASQTWMEIYEDVSDDFDARLARALVAHAVTTGPRHVERFVPVD